MRRATCQRCLRAQRSCLCDLCPPAAALQNQVALLILQHPDEEKQAKGSARLLHLSLANSVLQVSAALPPETLHSLLYGDGRQAILLYPPDPAQADRRMTSDTAAIMPANTASSILPPARLRLVALDATWRKSRALLRAHPELATLPRLALPAQDVQRYQIRKAHAAHQLSTLEACVLGLGQLEARPAFYAPLLTAFAEFNARWQVFASSSEHGRAAQDVAGLLASEQHQ